MPRLLFFPTPAPDELIYSLLARYARMAGGLPPREAMAQVFNSPQRAAAWDLPCHLGQLATSIHMPVSHLIDRHTLLPYYGSSLPAGRITALKRWMTGDRHGGHIHAAIGVTASVVVSTTRLRYCSECAVKDAEEWGAPVWHRLHQCPGVVWCPLHDRPLIDSHVAVSARTHKHEAIALEVAMREVGNPIRVQNPQQAARIAARSLDLLEGRGPSGADAWRRRHRALCAKAGWITPGGNVRWTHLRSAADTAAPWRLWEALGLRCDLEKDTHWLPALLRKPRKASHPLLQILAESLLIDLAVTSSDSCNDVRPRISRKKSSHPTSPVSSDKVMVDRGAWRRLAHALPADGPTAWRSQEPALYTRLYRHSRQWLHAWNAKHRRPSISGHGARKDWAMLDRRMTAASPHALAALVTSPESSRQRVSRAALLRQLGLPGLHPTQLKKLPGLASALDRMTESSETFLRRRLGDALRTWAAEFGHPPQPWQLLRLANVRWPWTPLAFETAQRIIDHYSWLQRRKESLPQDVLNDADQRLATGVA